MNCVFNPKETGNQRLLIANGGICRNHMMAGGVPIFQRSCDSSQFIAKIMHDLDAGPYTIFIKILHGAACRLQVPACKILIRNPACRTLL